MVVTHDQVIKRLKEEYKRKEVIADLNYKIHEFERNLDYEGFLQFLIETKQRLVEKGVELHDANKLTAEIHDLYNFEIEKIFRKE